MAIRYPIILHTEDQLCFGVTVPDLPGCFSAGNSIDDAIEKAREAILLHAEVMLEDGESIPLPSEFVNISDFYPDEGTALLAFVDVDLEPLLGPAKRINITIRPALLQVIDIRARSRGMSRSEYLAYAGTRFEE